MITALCVSGRPELRDELVDGLKTQGVRALSAVDLRTAVAMLQSHRPSVVLCDVVLPGRGAHELVQYALTRCDVPSVIVADERDDTEELLAFTAGADDFVCRPVSSRILTARLSVVVRRRTASLAPHRTAADILEHEGIVLVRSARQVSVGEAPVHLTRTEFDLLARLMEAPHVVLERSELMRAAWGEWSGDDHLLEVHVSRLRAKIQAAGGPPVIDAVRGVGYRLVRRLRTVAPRSAAIGEADVDEADPENALDPAAGAAQAWAITAQPALG